jgi:hypothetical protein
MNKCKLPKGGGGTILVDIILGRITQSVWRINKGKETEEPRLISKKKLRELFLL